MSVTKHFSLESSILIADASNKQGSMGDKPQRTSHSQSGAYVSVANIQCHYADLLTGSYPPAAVHMTRCTVGCPRPSASRVSAASSGERGRGARGRLGAVELEGGEGGEDRARASHAAQEVVPPRLRHAVAVHRPALPEGGLGGGAHAGRADARRVREGAVRVLVVERRGGAAAPAAAIVLRRPAVLRRALAHVERGLGGGSLAGQVLGASGAWRER